MKTLMMLLMTMSSFQAFAVPTCPPEVQAKLDALREQEKVTLEINSDIVAQINGPIYSKFKGSPVQHEEFMNTAKAITRAMNLRWSTVQADIMSIEASSSCR